MTALRQSLLTPSSTALVLALALSPTPAAAETVARHTIMPGTPYATDYFVKSTQEAYGPKVCVIGGCHGNEVAGYLAARELLKWHVTNGTLIVLPEAHKEAIRRNVRAYPGNMNALFPGDPNGSSMARLASEIWRMIDTHRPGLLITLHESIGNHKLSSGSYGYTLCHDFSALDPFFQRCIDRVNPDISDPLHKFEIFVEPHPACPTYCAWSRLRIPATSIETCMEGGLQTRVRHQLMMCMGMFDEAGLGYVPDGVPKLSTSDRGPASALEFWAPHLAAAGAGQAPSKRYALLFVRSDVLEAQVFVDGYYKGCTPAPMAIETPLTGRTVHVRVQQRTAWEADVPLQPNSVRVLDAPLPG